MNALAVPILTARARRINEAHRRATEAVDHRCASLIIDGILVDGLTIG
ncbi:hypothetical protein [Sphingomonas sp.]|nr:hypothetical protein [Sphingomonas sp.]MBX9795941.1 hypothetical protein [Sphingomonas sp.]